MKNTFKKIAALVLAIACVMSITISASAANVTVPDGTMVCADLYIPMTVHGLIDATAHLHNDSVPPKKAPTVKANQVTINANGRMQITFDLPNQTFVLTDANKAAFASGKDATGGGARIIGATWDTDSKSNPDHTERATSITIEFDSLDTEYVFPAVHEFAHHHFFVDLNNGYGAHTFDLYFKAVQ